MKFINLIQNEISYMINALSSFELENALARDHCYPSILDYELLSKMTAIQFIMDIY